MEVIVEKLDLPTEVGDEHLQFHGGAGIVPWRP
jgi:hypothetical protein